MQVNDFRDPQQIEHEKEQEPFSAHYAAMPALRRGK